MKKILFALTTCLIGIGGLTAGSASAQIPCGPEGPPGCTPLPPLYPAQVAPPTTTIPPTTTTVPPQIQPLPATGGNVSNALRGGALLVVGGLIAVGITRRRRTASPA